MYKRDITKQIVERLTLDRHFIQIIAGARQTGKTTAINQSIADLKIPSFYISCDEPTLHDRIWLEQQWMLARKKTHSEKQVVLVIDEIQKVTDWQETVKRLWDEDSKLGIDIRVALLGSAPLLIGKGASESLAGRFEVIHTGHWSFLEMHDAFGWELEQYILLGGYPGTVPIIDDFTRWQRYVLDSLIEPTVVRDILSLNRIDKPALLRSLFHLGCAYSGRIVALTKIIGQLQDAGNTTTLAHYIELLNQAGLLRGIPKYSGDRLRQRSSLPKFLVYNTALMTAESGQNPGTIRENPALWGRWVESAVGAGLINQTLGTTIELFYWRERDKEVDFVLRKGDNVSLIEVKSGHRRESQPGMAAFENIYGACRKYLVGQGGIPLEEFFRINLSELFF